ncbi:unnamed protein product [Polarella glacialis]|uniref:Uncharacterized protein n=1 Tax=Polarella glacialis TaxID=89957 RepID=A0A813DKQ1_POLGL|nr:unnamed protein product [Polarella glacialis]CAE8681356.1 unnamed protein product [Polarella glacialis]
MQPALAHLGPLLFHNSRMASLAPESRIDPEDGKARTYAQLLALTKDAHTVDQIKEYWETKCKPLPAGAGDPFKTESSLLPRVKNLPSPPSETTGTPPLPPAQVLLSQNPFLLNVHHDDRTVFLQKDPFMTHQMHQKQGQEMEVVGVGARQAEEATVDLREKLKHWSESLLALMGSGDPDKQQRTRTILVALPVLMFVWELVLFSLVQHVSSNACYLLSVILLVMSGTGPVMWFLGKRWGPVSLLSLGVLCLLAISLGSFLGKVGWELFWRQFFWMQTGSQIIMTSASTPAGSRSDAAILGFHDDSGMNENSVDPERSAGFKDGHIFCVAPILNSAIAGSSQVLVNYWAIGIDCCEPSGAFTCDDSREIAGGYGVVMLNGGLPCPSCNREKFQAAVHKAEAKHAVVSSTDALFVKYVSNPGRTKLMSGACAMIYLLLSMLIGGAIVAGLGFLFWYYGFGKRSPTGVPYAEDNPEERDKIRFE